MRPATTETAKPGAKDAARWLVVVLAVAGLAGAAVFDRLTSGVESGDVKEAAGRLDRVPREFGDWTGTDLPIEDKVLRVAEAAGCVSRVYTSRKNGAAVSVLMLCGPTGPIGAHEPKYCYAGNGYEENGPKAKRAATAADGTAATYWTVQFAKKPPTADVPLRVCWMWGLDGNWSASDSPRSEFALKRALYKLYVVRAEPKPLAKDEADPIHEFLLSFLPEAKKALTPDSPG